MHAVPTAALPSLPLCPTSARYTYHVVVSAAQMPNTCKGVYKRIAVLRVDRHERPVDWTPQTIRACRGVEIVETWERLNVGLTERCAFKRALVEANELQGRLSLEAMTQHDRYVLPAAAHASA
jgi:hypothetical protein